MGCKDYMDGREIDESEGRGQKNTALEGILGVLGRGFGVVLWD